MDGADKRVAIDIAEDEKPPASVLKEAQVLELMQKELKQVEFQFGSLVRPDADERRRSAQSSDGTFGRGDVFIQGGGRLGAEDQSLSAARQASAPRHPRYSQDSIAGRLPIVPGGQREFL